MQHYLIEDYFEPAKQEIFESIERGEKIFILEGDFGRVNFVNGNRRRYRREIVEPQFEELQRTVFDKGDMIYGRLEHPLTEEDLIPDYRDACVGIFELKLDEKDFMKGKAVVLSETEKGHELAGIIKGFLALGKKPIIGQSTRSVGSLRQITENNQTFLDVEDDFRFLTVDVVKKPSAGSYTAVSKQRSLAESLGDTWLNKNGVYTPDYDKEITDTNYKKKLENNIGYILEQATLREKSLKN